MQSVDPKKYSEANDKEKLELVLRSWEFTDIEGILDNLHEKGILLHHVYWIDWSDWKDLFPKEKLGNRIEFRAFWRIFQDEVTSKAGRNARIETKKDICDILDKMYGQAK
ncbi:uncharacterized protein LOC129795147 [Lutzomyia longipalpis]|uniref:uncharacterized protein LOC129795147 n=1 Tax=Lutzomyia longipalpis TaxID=7200 RepID=UPI00248342FE|nr:uncharacterized protein LOC129795147 [Lutzomyia longipalpis]